MPKLKCWGRSYDATWTRKCSYYSSPIANLHSKQVLTVFTVPLLFLQRFCLLVRSQVPRWPRTAELLREAAGGVHTCCRSLLFGLRCLDGGTILETERRWPTNRSYGIEKWGKLEPEKCEVSQFHKWKSYVWVLSSIVMHVSGTTGQVRV